MRLFSPETDRAAFRYIKRSAIDLTGQLSAKYGQVLLGTIGMGFSFEIASWLDFDPGDLITPAQEKLMLSLAPFLAYVFVTTFTPGPNNIMAMSNGLRYGYRRTLTFIGGVFCGFVVTLLLCSLLNFALFSLLPQVKFWMNILGAAYMIFLAVHIALSKPIEAGSRADGLNTFKAGFLMQFINLKGILYGITVYSSFIIPAYGNSWLSLVFAPLLAFIAMISTSCWAVGGDMFRRFLNRYNRIFNLAMGLLLVYTAIASLLEK